MPPATPCDGEIPLRCVALVRACGARVMLARRFSQHLCHNSQRVNAKELSCMTNLKLEPGVGVRSPQPSALSPQPSAYSVLSARIGSSAAARRAGSRAAAIATMATTMAAEV